MYVFFSRTAQYIITFKGITAPSTHEREMPLAKDDRGLAAHLLRNGGTFFILKELIADLVLFHYLLIRFVKILSCMRTPRENRCGPQSSELNRITTHMARIVRRKEERPLQFRPICHLRVRAPNVVFYKR